MAPYRISSVVSALVAACAGPTASADPGALGPSWFHIVPSAPSEAGVAVEPPSAGLIAGFGEIFEVVPLKYADV
ncbi:MAG: hypothetical protein JF593_15700, partial [Novosphingobium sp.]|nr:hypothetical protein [Novosphingobium sp.]